MKQVFATYRSVAMFVCTLLLTILFLLSFIFTFHNLVRIAVLILLLCIIVFQMIHYKKTKLKKYEVRIIITLLILIGAGHIIHEEYGIIKNNQAKTLVKTKEKISYRGLEISQELENNLEFVNSKHLFRRFIGYDATIHYTNGTTEKVTIYEPVGLTHIGLIQIKDDRYFIYNFLEIEQSIEKGKPTAGA